MKLVILTPIIPFPLDEGGKVSQYAFLEYLQNYIDIHLFLVVNSFDDNKDIDELQLKLSKVKIYRFKNFQEKIVVTKKIPLIKKIFWKISDLINPPKKQKININKKEFDDFDREIEFGITLNREITDLISQNLEDIKPDLVQIEHNFYLNTIGFLKKYNVIFVEHEIQFARLLSLKKEFYTPYEEYKISLYKYMEISLLNQYNQVFVFSENDKELLISENINTKIYVSPFPVLDNFFTPTKLGNKGIEKIVFVGGSSHYPNKDAIEWYINNISKVTFQKTGLKFHVIGKCQPEFIEKYKHNEIVVFDGFVEDLNKACENSIFIVPLRMGSGIRTKIIQGMAQQLPIVSTTIGAEGLGAETGKNILIADNPSDFSNEIIKLYNNLDLYNDIAINGFEFVKENFSQKVLGNKRLEIYKEIIDA